MRRTCVFLLVLALGWAPVQGATPVWIIPDVPTDETSSEATLLPWQIFRYGPPPGYLFELSIAGDPTVDAIERMDKPNNRLFSGESPSDLGGNLPFLAEPRWWPASSTIPPISSSPGALGRAAGRGRSAPSSSTAPARASRSRPT